MLAYVFWHWPIDNTTEHQYIDRLVDFHGRLGSFPPERFLGSTAARLTSAPWLDTSPAFEDWYFVEDFAALGLLNEAAAAGHRQPSHDGIAALAQGGTGGLYALLSGDGPGAASASSLWFDKPAGVPYAKFHAALNESLLSTSLPHALWQRQMVLGPAPEYCLQGSRLISLPPNALPHSVGAKPLFP